MLLALYDAVHATAMTTAGATSFMHEAKVDVVTVPNLSEHLFSADTTSQLSARFAYASAMKSINNLLLLGDGETWARQRVDFAGLPEMVRTFLQVAAGAADIPVADSDTRNDDDMVSARQARDLRRAQMSWLPPYRAGHFHPSAASPSTNVSPSRFSSTKARASATASSAATRAGACDTTINCERTEAAAISRARGASRSGWRLASGSFSTIKGGGRGDSRAATSSR